MSSTFTKGNLISFICPVVVLFFFLNNSKRKKNRLEEEIKRTILSRKEIHLRKRLVLAELHAGVQISNKEVAVKPKFSTHHLKRSFLFFLQALIEKHQQSPRIVIFGKLSVDSLSCSSAHFPVFPFLLRVFPLPLATLPITMSSSPTLQ